MTWYLLTWLAWTCPGGPLGGLVPAPARPLVCRAEPRLELYDPARLERAKARTRELGCSAQLRRCRGLVCSSNMVSCETVMTFN